MFGRAAYSCSLWPAQSRNDNSAYSARPNVHHSGKSGGEGCLRPQTHVWKMVHCSMISLPPRVEEGLKLRRGRRRACDVSVAWPRTGREETCNCNQAVLVSLRDKDTKIQERQRTGLLQSVMRIASVLSLRQRLDVEADVETEGGGGCAGFVVVANPT
jgi:hypothetical protein